MYNLQYLSVRFVIILIFNLPAYVYILYRVVHRVPDITQIPTTAPVPQPQPPPAPPGLSGPPPGPVLAVEPPVENPPTTNINTNTVTDVHCAPQVQYNVSINLAIGLSGFVMFNEALMYNNDVFLVYYMKLISSIYMDSHSV